ncbi:T9SS type A sorting domain-containing protein [candidate division KSB1 bacterium]|nr:T9SS type A sorting domain-containing protein [candidate division KSB1 bacterium]
MLRDSLDTRLNIYVESSNEVWNTAPGFEQSTYNQAQAKALKIDEQQNHARRTVELAQIFQTVFGTGSLNNRIRVVLCSHAPMLKWWVEPMLRYIEEKYGAPKNFLYAIACQTYFGGGSEAGESVEKILADCRQSISSQVNETTGNQAGRMQWIQMAKKWGLPGGFCSYEGGPDHGGGSTVNVANRIRAERDPGMGDVLKYNYGDCFGALGGTLAMQFTLSSAFSRYGCWGLTDDINNPDRNHKFQAVRELVGVRMDSSDDGDDLPADFELLQNYPNPFNNVTRILFALPRSAHVTLEVYNIKGQKVAVLVDDYKKAARHEVQFGAAGLANGLYVCRLQAGPFTAIKKMLYLK